MKNFNNWNKIYKVIYNINNDQQESNVRKLDSIVQLEIQKFVDSIIHQSYSEYIAYAIMNDHQLELFSKYCNLANITYALLDITEDVILNNYKTDCEFTIKNVINTYLENNLTTDNVLDKINLKGFNSLSEIDLRILKS